MTSPHRRATPPSGGVFVWAPLFTLLLASCAENPPAECGDPSVSLTAIQGTSDRSPLLGEVVVVEAEVTASVETRSRRGVFIQASEPGDGSASSALYIELSDPTDLPPAGRLVRVTGTVHETEGLTALTSRQWMDCGTGPGVPIAGLRLGQALEPLEGMRVAIQGPATVTDAYAAGWGDLTVSGEGRLWQSTERVAPGREAQAAERSAAGSELLIRLAGRAPVLRVGDRLSGLSGILDQHNGYRLLAQGRPRVEVRNPRPAVPAKPTGSLRVAAVNLANFFNGDGRGGGFPTPRGAADPEQFDRQKSKLVTAIRALDADLLALAEVENDGYGPDSAIVQLADALTEASGRDYQPVRLPEGRPGDDEIAVGLIYDRARVKPDGPARINSGGPFQNLNRAPLMQRFRDERDHTLTLIAVHLKSKGCNDSRGANRAQGDGQACWSPVRVAASQALAEWVEASGLFGETLIIGDFNAYSREDPIRTLSERGFVHLRPPEPDYSFIYRGRSGILDHAFAGGDLAPLARRIDHWHINADEPAREDYRDVASDPTSPYRSSDHDPLVIDFDWP